VHVVLPIRETGRLALCRAGGDGSSVAIRKFARILSLLLSELPNQSDTGNIMVLVSL
jgi:hypothetical protein